MVKVQLDEKDFAERKPYFGAGVHEVVITELKKVEPESGAPYVEATVIGENDEKDAIRLYISEKAAPYTLSNLARIAVHNKETDAEKQKVRDAFTKITDTDQLDEKFLDKFKDMQAWILTEEDLNAPKPNGGYYLRSNLYSYVPKPRNASQMTAEQLVSDQNEKVDTDEIPFK